MMAKHLTDPKETATRKRIDTILDNLKWVTDESVPSCNVFTERCKTVDQQRAIKGNEPDYVLYRSGTDTIIAIIEAKRSGQSLQKALDQAIRLYAKPLGVNVIFVADGAIVESHDRRSGQGLRLDGELVTGLLPEKLLLRFADEGPNIRTPTVIQHTKQELIEVFREANNLLRKEGLREGIERFTEFSNFLFLKLISEIEEERERAGEKRVLEERYCWQSFCTKSATEMLDYINDTVLPRLAGRYNHSGDVFQTKMLITKPDTLKRIVDKLSKLQLLDADSDIKGDAFEYFLKNSVTVGNDLGEYFTPRHIVKLVVDLIDPKFGDTVYDPCCGTGGFLIEAFRHIKAKVKQTAAAMKALRDKTIFGRELTGTAKIAKMNMILTGDGHNNIKQLDSLEHPVKDKYNVVLTNYPFSQQTDYASYYGFNTEDANPVFLKHIIDSLSDGGKAGVIVPDGLLFDEQTEYVKIRRFLLENCSLSAVIKLHNYVFRPYTGQTTSILIFTKGSQTREVWFFDVREDGYKKTSSKRGRLPIRENDIPLLRQVWNDKSTTPHGWRAHAETIAQNKYNLSSDTYDPKTTKSRRFDEIELHKLANVQLGKTAPKADYNSDRNGRKILKYRDIDTSGTINWDNDGEGWICQELCGTGFREIHNGDVLLVASGHTSESIGTKAAFVQIPPGIPKPVYFCGELLRINILHPDTELLPSYLIHYLLTPQGYAAIQRCVKGMHLTQGRAKKIKIVKPPIEDQKVLVVKIKRLQKVIEQSASHIQKAKKQQVGLIQTFLG